MILPSLSYMQILSLLQEGPDKWIPGGQLYRGQTTVINEPTVIYPRSTPRNSLMPTNIGISALHLASMRIPGLRAIPPRDSSTFVTLSVEAARDFGRQIITARPAPGTKVGWCRSDYNYGYGMGAILGLIENVITAVVEDHDVLKDITYTRDGNELSKMLASYDSIVTDSTNPIVNKIIGICQLFGPNVRLNLSQFKPGQHTIEELIVMLFDGAMRGEIIGVGSVESVIARFTHSRGGAEVWFRAPYLAEPVETSSSNIDYSDRDK